MTDFFKGSCKLIGKKGWRISIMFSTASPNFAKSGEGGRRGIYLQKSESSRNFKADIFVSIQFLAGYVEHTQLQPHAHPRMFIEANLS